MDLLRLQSIRWTQALQQKFSPYGSESEFLRQMTSLYSVSFVTWWLFPLATFIHPILGHQAIVALIIANFVTVALKFLIPDDRPYWWFPMTKYSKNGADEMTIFEYPETCETTSGFPSTHATVFAAITYLIGTYLRMKMIKLTRKSHLTSPSRFTPSFFLPYLISSGIWIVNLLGIISRLYTFTSFHYQLITGMLLGFAIGKFASTVFNSNFVIFFSPVLGLLIFTALAWTPVDPAWTLQPALQWCWNTGRFLEHSKENIVVRTCHTGGLVGGLAIVQLFEHSSRKVNQTTGVLGTFLQGLLTFAEILVVRFFSSRFTTDQYDFSSHLFLQAAIIGLHVVATLFLVPSLVKKILNSN